MFTLHCSEDCLRACLVTFFYLFESTVSTTKIRNGTNRSNNRGSKRPFRLHRVYRDSEAQSSIECTISKSWPRKGCRTGENRKVPLLGTFQHLPSRFDVNLAHLCTILP